MAGGRCRCRCWCSYGHVRSSHGHVRSARLLPQTQSSSDRPPALAAPTAPPRSTTAARPRASCSPA
eukprot:4775979-Prymnesium_polylepis.1